MIKSQQNYPTDLNDTQWSKIRPYLPAKAQTGRPREHGWRKILNGIFYILQSGCAWRMLPTEMPPWKGGIPLFSFVAQGWYLGADQQPAARESTIEVWQKASS